MLKGAMQARDAHRTRFAVPIGHLGHPPHLRQVRLPDELGRRIEGFATSGTSPMAILGNFLERNTHDMAIHHEIVRYSDRVRYL